MVRSRELHPFSMAMFPLAAPGRSALCRGVQRDAADAAEAYGLRSGAGRAGHGAGWFSRSLGSLVV